jgi:hypothetical protein
MGLAEWQLNHAYSLPELQMGDLAKKVNVNEGPIFFHLLLISSSALLQRSHAINVLSYQQWHAESTLQLWERTEKATVN